LELKLLEIKKGRKMLVIDIALIKT